MKLLLMQMMKSKLVEEGSDPISPEFAPKLAAMLEEDRRREEEVFARLLDASVDPRLVTKMRLVCQEAGFLYAWDECLSFFLEVAGVGYLEALSKRYPESSATLTLEKFRAVR